MVSPGTTGPPGKRHGGDSSPQEGCSVSLRAFGRQGTPATAGTTRTHGLLLGGTGPLLTNSSPGGGAAPHPGSPFTQRQF